MSKRGSLLMVGLAMLLLSVVAGAMADDFTAIGSTGDDAWKCIKCNMTYQQHDICWMCTPPELATRVCFGTGGGLCQYHQPQPRGWCWVEFNGGPAENNMDMLLSPPPPPIPGVGYCNCHPHPTYMNILVNYFVNEVGEGNMMHHKYWCVEENKFHSWFEPCPVESLTPTQFDNIVGPLPPIGPGDPPPADPPPGGDPGNPPPGDPPPGGDPGNPPPGP